MNKNKITFRNLKMFLILAPLMLLLQSCNQSEEEAVSSSVTKGNTTNPVTPVSPPANPPGKSSPLPSGEFLIFKGKFFPHELPGVPASCSIKTIYAFEDFLFDNIIDNFAKNPWHEFKYSSEYRLNFAKKCKNAIDLAYQGKKASDFTQTPDQIKKIFPDSSVQVEDIEVYMKRDVKAPSNIEAVFLTCTSCPDPRDSKKRLTVHEGILACREKN